MLGPIFDREWLTLPRRPRHYLLRVLSLGGLWVLALTVWQTTVGWDVSATLGDLARFGLLLFQVLLFTQLVLVFFFSALSAASTISQEKDRRTFVLLLLTDLRNYEIVLGKMLGSLLQLGIFLAGMLPILMMLLFLGGVAPRQVLEGMVVLAGTGLAAGSLGGLVALWREKTFQALALTVLILVLYLCAVQALSALPLVSESIAVDDIQSVQRVLHPFLSLESVFDRDEDAIGFSPALGFGITMLAISVLLNLWGIWKLRVWNPSGEPIMQRDSAKEEAEERDRLKAHAAPGRARPVWKNPILWREVGTRAYGRRPFLVKGAYFLVLALVAWIVLGADQRTDWIAAKGLAPIAILSLLLVSAQAVTAITSERDLGALDLLLVTDLSPREFIFGKLLGILWNTKEFLLPPLVLAAFYAWRGWLASPARNHPEQAFFMNLEAYVALTVGMIVLFAFTMLLGVHVALRSEKSRVAVVTTLGTVFFLSVGTLICIYLILINGRFEYQWLSFVMFLFAGCVGLERVLSGERPSGALITASFLCPPAVFYCITNLLIGRPGIGASSDPLMPFLVLTGSFAFAITAMLVPLLSEFDVAMGRTSGAGE